MIERLIIAGGRDVRLSDDDLAKLDALVDVREVVTGGARGVGTDALLWARRRRIKETVFLPDWAKYGKRAGPIRNTFMAQYGTDLAVFDGGRGTEHMLSMAIVHKLTIHDFRTKDNT